MESPSLSKNNNGVVPIANRQSGRVGLAGATFPKLTVLQPDTLAYINPVLYNPNYVITRDNEYSMGFE